MKTVLFVDIDGVFHPTDERTVRLVIDETNRRLVIEGEDLFRWAPILATLLAAHPEVGVVVHSSWRHHHTREELLERFPECLRVRITGITEGSGRHESILAYAGQHSIDRFLVIDDQPGSFPKHWPPLLVCDSHTGLSDPGVQARIKVFLSGNQDD